MADLFDRLFPDIAGLPIPNISVHTMRAALGDYAAGHSSRAEIVAYWDLDTDAQNDLDALLTAIDSKSALGKAAFLLELHDVMLIAQAGAKYTTKADFRTRLGL